MAEGWAGDHRSASSRRVSSSSELDLPSGDHCESGLLQLDVPLLRAQLRGSRLLDAMRMYRQGRASPPLNYSLSFLELPLPLPIPSCLWTDPRCLFCTSTSCVGSLLSLQPSLFLSLFLSTLLTPLFLFSLPYSSPLYPPALPAPHALLPQLPPSPFPGLDGSVLPTAAEPVPLWSHRPSGGNYLQEQAGTSK